MPVMVSSAPPARERSPLFAKCSPNFAPRQNCDVPGLHARASICRAEWFSGARASARCACTQIRPVMPGANIEGAQYSENQARGKWQVTKRFRTDFKRKIAKGRKV